MTEKITVYITKYALTGGIQEVQAKACGDGMVEYCAGPGQLTQFFHGDDRHHTRFEAVDRAEKMRAKKLASLRDQIARLEKRVF